MEVIFYLSSLKNHWKYQCIWVEKILILALVGGGKIFILCKIYTPAKNTILPAPNLAANGTRRVRLPSRIFSFRKSFVLGSFEVFQQSFAGLKNNVAHVTLSAWITNKFLSFIYIRWVGSKAKCRSPKGSLHKNQIREKARYINERVK